MWLRSSSRTGESHERTRSIPCAAVGEGGAHAANDNVTEEGQGRCLPDPLPFNTTRMPTPKHEGLYRLWTEAWPTQPNTVPEGKKRLPTKGGYSASSSSKREQISTNLKRPTLQNPERRGTHHGACARCCRAAWRRQSRSGRPVRALRRRPWSMPTTARANREAGDAEARVRPVRSRFGRISVLGHAE